MWTSDAVRWEHTIRTSLVRKPGRNVSFPLPEDRVKAQRKEQPMKHAVWGAAAVAFALAGCAPATEEAAAADGGQEAITRRVPQFENEHVEVWKSIILPNQPLSLHRHDNPRAIIALNGGTLRVVNESGDAHDMTWETGSAYWLDADTLGELHGDVNEGDAPVEVIVVELKNVGGF